MYVKKAKNAGSAVEWRAWADQMIVRNSTNTSALPRKEWPSLVNSITDTDRSWQIGVTQPEENSGDPPLVMVYSIGGFESIGLIIGPETYVEDPPSGQISKIVYPGIYVRVTH
jgi:hypothetical protein